MQRIDFGPQQLRPEGGALATDAHVWRLGSLRAEMLSMVGERFRRVCSSAGLWAGTRPDTLQLTKIGTRQRLAQHWDRRERWQDGVGSVVWSELPSEGDLRGDRSAPPSARVAAAATPPPPPIPPARAAATPRAVASKGCHLCFGGATRVARVAGGRW